jgi:hypothetical protein
VKITPGSADRYPGAVHPQGRQYLAKFCLDPFPVFRYQVDGLTLEKTAFLGRRLQVGTHVRSRAVSYI